MKKRKLRDVLNIVFLVLLIVLTFYFLLRDQDMDELMKTFQQVNLWYVGLGVLLMFFYIYAEAVCTKSVFNSLDTKVSIFKCMKYAFVGYYYSALTPSASGGQPMQIFYMRSDKIQTGHASLVILLVTVAYKVTLLLFGFGLLIFGGSFLTSKLGNVVPLFIFGVLFNLVTVILLFFVIFSPKIARWCCTKCVSFLAKIRILKTPEKTLENLESQLNEYSSGAAHVKNHPWILIKITLITVVQRIAIFSVTYCVYRAFGLSELSFLYVILLQSVISISVDMLPFPGGAGITEVCFMQIFTTIFITDAMLKSGLLLSRGITYYLFLLISGGVSFAAQLIHTRNKSKERQLQEE